MQNCQLCGEPLVPAEHFCVPCGARTFAGPFVGRQGERLRLQGALQGALEGRPQWITVLADAGIGKSRLTRSALQAWNAGKALRAQAMPQDKAPLGLVSALLTSWVGTADGLSRQVEMAFPQDHDLACGLLGPLLGAPGHPAADSLSPEHRQAAQFQALTDLLLHAAHASPLLLILEDLQWLDESSRRWLAHLASALPGQTDLPLAILVEARLEADAQLADLGAGLDLTRVYLGPLSAADGSALVHGLLGAAERSPGDAERSIDGAERSPGDAERSIGDAERSLDERLVARIVDKAEGNPLFIEEMVRALGREPGADLTSELPDTLVALVARRLDDLPAGTRRVAQVAAVLGRTFDPDMLARVAAQGVGDALERLCSVHIVVPDAGRTRYVFAQQVTWEVAYNSLPLPERRAVHGRVAQALADRAGDRAAALIAHHWGQAAEAAKAAEAFHRAGLAASRALSTSEARLHYLAALDWLSQAPADDCTARAFILLDLAQVEVSLGSYQAASDRLDERDELAPADARSLEVRGDVLERKGDFPAALAAFRSEAGCAADASGRARALAKLGSVHLRMGNLQEAIATAHDALAQLDGRDLPREAAFAHSVLGMCHHRMGASDDATRHHQIALTLRERARDLAGIAKSLNNLGIVANTTGRWSEAYGHYTRALALFRKLGDRGYVAMALNNMGNLLLLQGDAAQAERHFREALRIARQVGDSVAMATALGNLGEAHLIKEAPAEALSFLDSCLGLTAQMVHHEYEAEVHLARARALAALGDQKAAGHALLLAREVALLSGNAAFSAVLDCVEAEFALRSGDRATALALAERAENGLRPSMLRLELGRTLLVLSRILPPERAGAARAEAVEIFQALGARRDLELAQAGEGEGVTR